MLIANPHFSATVTRMNKLVYKVFRKRDPETTHCPEKSGRIVTLDRLIGLTDRPKYTEPTRFGFGEKYLQKPKSDRYFSTL